MIRFFRQSYLVQYVSIALLCIAIWIPSFITGNLDVAWRSSVTPLYNWVADLLDFWPPAMQIVAMLLMVLEAMFFNAMLASNQLVTKVSTLGAVVFLLMMNLLPEQTTFYPFLLSSVFLLMFIHTMFALYQTQRPELYLLNAGLYISLASMCYFPAILLVIWGDIAVAIIHKGSVRLHIIPIIGLLLPYFFYFAVHFLMGDLMPCLQSYADFFTGIQLSITGFNWLKISVLAFMLVALVMPWFSNNYSFEKSIAVRTKVNMSVYLLFFGILMLFLGEEPMQTGVFFISLSVFFSYQLAYLDRLKWANITFIILIVAVLTSHYVPIFI